ncbi:DUF4012 domain-containing protein [Arthrobacter gengyunqii]|uniref:DUF4012 domain-containing protein n=1 Tax=Arthrobacter gengyunqii TaxID=2886940 RepID=A0ABS8GIV1_9MICC|nr:DUF4012 domain-containing protein [Arthrobacter gengyunqii]MCC3266577.1 DUF4012 domain-containing protein [Arthrobacter gengyunqii]
MTSNDDGQTRDKDLHGPESQRGRTRGESRRRIIRRIGFGVLGFVIAVGGAGALLAHQVSSVRSQLVYAMDLAPQLRADVESEDHRAAEIILETIQEQTSAARSTATGPLWKAASYIPVLGSNFSAVREVAVSANDITIRAVAPLLDRYGSLNLQTLSPTDGRFNIAEIQEAAPSISTAANTVQLSYQRLASLDLSRLLPEVAQPVSEATEQLEKLTEILDTASSTSQLLPAMLGADGPRNYLVLVQNSSEARATGGIPGALVILHTDDGRVSLGEHTSAVALGAFRPTLEVDSEQVALFTGRLGTQMQNVNLTPHFPTAAQTATLMWEERHPDQKIDGVLALDPVVLSHLLEATGPLDLTDVQVLAQIRTTGLPSSLTKDNVVPTLLSEVYKEIDDPEAQDAYFAAVAGRVFSAFTEGQGDGTQLAKALGTSIKENRLYLWSSHPSEQSIVASTPLQGSVTGRDAGGTAFGVYFNDGTGAKMDYYASRTVQLVKSCQAGEYSQYTVRVTVTNNAPNDAGTTLPAYVTGEGVFGVEPGRIRTNYVVYGPSQAFVETATVDGQSVPISSGRHGQRPVGTVPLELGPGETSTIEMLFSGVVQNSEPLLRVTPTIQPSKEVIGPLERDTCG